MRDALRKRYPAPEWALLEEVRNQVGYSKRVERYADAIAINLWPSRGLEILGFEIKCSRSDWVRELKDPSKSDEIQKYCDRWWIVAGGRNIVQPGELPPTWGLMVTHGVGEKSRLVCVQEAPKLEPKVLDKGFLIAMLRRATEAAERAQKQEDNEIYQKGFLAGKKQAESSRDSEFKYLKREHDDLLAHMKRFTEESGVNLHTHNRWEFGNIGLAVRVVLKNLHNPMDKFDALRQSAAPLRAYLRAVEELEKSFRLMEDGAKELGPLA